MWMQFSIQVILFQIISLFCAVVTLVIMTFTAVAGAVTYMCTMFILTTSYLYLVFPFGSPELNSQAIRPFVPLWKVFTLLLR
jgi:hypothetical protein